MTFIIFTKHLEGWDLPQIIAGLKAAGFDGADLCVRPGYPVNPENARQMLPEAAKAFRAEGMSVPLVTTPGDFRDPADKRAAPLFDACARAGVPLLKLGYWRFNERDDYWQLIDTHRRQLEGFARLARKYGVKPVVHTHSGPYMGLNASAAHHLVDRFEPAEVGVFLDAGHLAMCSEPMQMAISIVRKYVSCFAFKDLVSLPGRRGEREVYYPHTRRLGWGAVDWHEVVSAIIRADMQELPISLHSESNGIPPESVLDIARVDLRFIRKMFADLGGPPVRCAQTVK